MIGLIDYGMGNLQSVRNACERLGRTVKTVSQPAEIEGLEQLILPGVGSFAEGMRHLQDRKLDRALREGAKRRFFSLLGICLGMQLLADEGTEGGVTPGLGLLRGSVPRLENPGNLRIPHMGWNNIKVTRANPLITAEMQVDYYFVHSYHFKASSDETLATCEYGQTFTCAVGQDNVYGVQFHPEKSHDYGLRLLKNFFESCHVEKKAYPGTVS